MKTVGVELNPLQAYAVFEALKAMNPALPPPGAPLGAAAIPSGILSQSHG